MQLRAACNYHYAVPVVRTQVYGINSIKYRSINSWNYLNNKLLEKQLYAKSRALCKNLITEYLLKSYSN